LIINGIRALKEKVNMLYQEKHHHHAGANLGQQPSWVRGDDAFLIFEWKGGQEHGG
jgi:hypothetical protein